MKTLCNFLKLVIMVPIFAVVIIPVGMILLPFFQDVNNKINRERTDAS